MGFPKPLGPYAVAFADFELRRPRKPSSASSAATFPVQHQDGAPAAAQTSTPLLRFFYPTHNTPPKLSNPINAVHRAWLPHIMYTWGYICKIFPPSSCLRRFAIWILAGLAHFLFFPSVIVQASISSPLLLQVEDGEEKRLPVVVFSHGLWACRTTYTAFCCDLASHGYVVVALEHLDGSANIASFADSYGKRKWILNSFATTPIERITLQDRIKQLNQRVLEVQKVVDVLESLDRGLLTQDANVVHSKAALDVSMFKNRLDLQHIAVSGHSFGGATAVVAAGIDKRLKCCLALDVWWEPIEKVEYSKVAGKIPVLLLNTESFDWKTLREGRMMFLNARAEATNDGKPLETELLTIKGTAHQDQSDINLLFPGLMKRLGWAGTLDPVLTKDINSRRCLDFLYKHLLPPGTRGPYAIEGLEQDQCHLIIGTIMHKQ